MTVVVKNVGTVQNINIFVKCEQLFVFLQHLLSFDSSEFHISNFPGKGIYFHFRVV